jgi:hypothetical protein
MAQQVAWRKSSYSGGQEGSECVEVAVSPSAVGVRDSKAATAGEPAFSPTAWQAFVLTTGLLA